MQITGRQVLFRPLTEADFEQLIAWSAYPKSSYFLFEDNYGARLTVSLEREVKSPDKPELIIQDNLGRPFGLFKIEMVNPLNKTASFRLGVFAPGPAPEAWPAALEYIFSKYEVNRVETAILKRESAMLALLKKTGFKLDGVLREQFYYQRKYHEICIFSILRREFKK